MKWSSTLLPVLACTVELRLTGHKRQPSASLRAVVYALALGDVARSVGNDSVVVCLCVGAGNYAPEPRMTIVSAEGDSTFPGFPMPQ